MHTNEENEEELDDDAIPRVKLSGATKEKVVLLPNQPTVLLCSGTQKGETAEARNVVWAEEDDASSDYCFHAGVHLRAVDQADMGAVFCTDEQGYTQVRVVNVTDTPCELEWGDALFQIREVKEMCSAVQIPVEVKAELTEEQQVLLARYSTAEAQGFLSATGACQDKKMTGTTASVGQTGKEGAPKWQGDHLEGKDQSLLGEYSNANTGSSQAEWCPDLQQKTAASAVDSNDADKEGKEIKVSATPVAPKVTFVAPTENAVPDQPAGNIMTSELSSPDAHERTVQTTEAIRAARSKRARVKENEVGRDFGARRVASKGELDAHIRRRWYDEMPIKRNASLEEVLSKRYRVESIAAEVFERDGRRGYQRCSLFGCWRSD